MSTIYAPAAAYMRSAIADSMKEAELRLLAERFVEFKIEEGGVFGLVAALHCRMFGGDEHRAAAAAAAVELMILSLDIYDDLQDRDNSKVPWSQVDPALALNVAIGLQALSIEVIMTLPGESSRNATAAAFLNRGILKAVNGQHTDLLNYALTEEQCLQMIEDKSGSLAAAACLVGTAVAADEHFEIVEEYGRAMGVAAQIRNDVQGIQRWDTRNDLLARKQTLPIQFVLEQQSEEAAMVRSYYDGDITVDEFLSKKHEIMDFIQSCGSIEYALVHARLKQYEAEAAISQLPVEDRWKEELRQYT